jgi:hypothetical protein
MEAMTARATVAEIFMMGGVFRGGLKSLAREKMVDVGRW